MTLGEKIRKYRLLHNLKQKDLGMMIGFSSSTADSRIRKYEGDIMAPKSEIRNRLVQALDVDPSALSDIDIHSIEDVVRTFFFMEECLGFEIESFDSNQRFFFNKEKTYFSDREISILNSYMYIWQEQKKNLLNITNDSQEDSDKEYELWKSRFPRDIYSYWNSLMDKIDVHYSPIVDKISDKQTQIVYSAEFIAQIRLMIQTGLCFEVNTELHQKEQGALTFTFQTTDIITPKDEETEKQFSVFLNNLNILSAYGMKIGRQILTYNTGSSISYYLYLSSLMTKSSIIEEIQNFEKNKDNENDFSTSIFEAKYKKESSIFNLNLKEEIEKIYKK